MIQTIIQLSLKQKKSYVIDSESKGNYAKENSIKFITNSIESSLCDYFNAFILVTGNVTLTGGNEITKAALKIVHHLKLVEQK